MRHKDLEKLVKESKKPRVQNQFKPTHEELRKVPELDTVVTNYIFDLTQAAAAYFALKTIYVVNNEAEYQRVFARATTHYDRVLAARKKILELKKRAKKVK